VKDFSVDNDRRRTGVVHKRPPMRDCAPGAYLRSGSREQGRKADRNMKTRPMKRAAVDEAIG
jgi:hypothetical protein